MKVRARLADPSETAVTLQITMSVTQWQKLKGWINSNDTPAYEVKGAIDRAMKRVMAVIEEDVDVTNQTSEGAKAP